MRVTEAEIEAALTACAPKAVDALQFAKRRIEDYHRKQLPADRDYTDAAGVSSAARWIGRSAIRGALCTAARRLYPSSVLMNAVPAKVAGVATVSSWWCRRRAACSIRWSSRRRSSAGVHEVYRIGGAQAIGRASLRHRDGHRTGRSARSPAGNAYVAAAKRRVFGTVAHRRGRRPRRSAGAWPIANNDPAWIAGGSAGARPSTTARRNRFSSPTIAAIFARRLVACEAGETQLLTQLTSAAAIARARLAESRRRSSWCADLSASRRRSPIASPPNMSSSLLVDPEARWRRRSIMPARSFLAATRPKRSAITSPVPTTCCRRRAARALPRASACSIS